MQPVEVAPQLSRPPPLVADPLTDAANAPPSLPFPMLAAGWGSPILSSPLTAEKPPLSGTEGSDFPFPRKEAPRPIQHSLGCADAAKDPDDFGPLAQELKSIQDEINEVGDEMKGRLEVKTVGDFKIHSEPASPATFFLSEISPASPFFMAPATVGAFEYANQAAVSCAFGVGRHPSRDRSDTFFCLAEVMPASPFFMGSPVTLGGFDRVVSCGFAADQITGAKFPTDTDGDNSPYTPSALADKEFAWTRLVPL